MINLARNFHVMHRNQLQGKWDRTMPQTEICGQVVGIVGLGSIGKEIAKKASFFGMRVIGVQKEPQAVKHVQRVYGPEEMEAVFKESDYVINLLPLTEDTKGIISEKSGASKSTFTSPDADGI